MDINLKFGVPYCPLDGPQIAVLRAVAGDNPGAVVETYTVNRVTRDLSLTQRKLAIRRLINSDLIRAARAYGSLGYSITRRGIEALNAGTKIIVHDEVSDDRPSIGGHPLPLSIVQIPPLPPKRSDDIPIPEAAHAYVVDGDGYQILRFYTEQPEGRLLKALVEHLARKPETMADLALAEKSAKVAKLRLENERAIVAERQARSSVVAVRPDDILFVAGSVRGLLDILVTPDEGNHHRAAVMAAASIRDILAGYVSIAEGIVADGYARRDTGAERLPT